MMKSAVPEIAIFRCQEYPFFALALAKALGLVIFNDPLNSLSNKT